MQQLKASLEFSNVNALIVATTQLGPKPGQTSDRESVRNYIELFHNPMRRRKMNVSKSKEVFLTQLSTETG